MLRGPLLRPLGRSLSFTCLLAVCASILLSAPRAAETPNFVFVLADDLGYGDPGCYNPDSKIPTPNIDRLAREGMRFTDAHSPSAVCTPTRYALLTGRYCWRTPLKRGVLWGYDPLLIDPGRETVASLLQKQGYATACIGKWHLGLGRNKPTDYSDTLSPGPNAVGFDHFFGIPASLDMEPYVFVRNQAITSPLTGTVEASAMRRNGGGGFWRKGPLAEGFKHEDVLPVLTGEAERFIRQQRREKPFFLYLAFASPHTPWMPSPEFTGKSGAGHYGDFVAQTDAALGRVLSALEESGLAGNTMVFFTSDNGAHWLPSDIEKFNHRANGSWRGQKADIWEGGHRVPFIARWPGHVQAGAMSSQLIGLLDFMATAAEMVGAEIPAGTAEDSVSFLPALLGDDSAPAARRQFVHHSLEGAFAIRQDDWKLITALGSHGFSHPKNIEPEKGGPEGQLYDLRDDPGEQANLWLEKPEIVARLSTLLEREKSGDY